jgi:nucleotide-binding universal stress UspA family protein
MDATADGGGTERPVVVGVDPTASARGAAGWAADLAAAWGAPLHLVHAGAAGVGRERPAWLTELADAADRTGVRPVVAAVVPGGPVEVLLERARGARVLVLGSYGTGSEAGMLAGTVALALVGRAGCPVAVVRGAGPELAPPRGGPVVAGVDGSPSGRAALLLAADVAVALGARLDAVHACAGEPRAAAEALLDAELAAVAQAHPGLPVEREIVEDTPVRPLIDRADGARMLVVGQRGHVPEPTMLHPGSTSRALVEFAPCPVVVTSVVGTVAG